MERLFILGAAAVAGDATWGLKGRLRASGGNAGNLLVGHAVRRQLDSTALGDMDTHPVEQVRGSFDRIVVAATNFLAPHFDLSRLADVVETADLPCLMVGLGAQANDYEPRLAESLPAGTVRFVRAVAERSAVIGVRGEYTASVLDDLGVTNVVVLGCPSFYTNLSAPLRLTRRSLADIDRIVVNGIADVVGHSFDPVAKADVERMLFRLAVAANHPYVFQSERAEILYLWRQIPEFAEGLAPGAGRAGYRDAGEYAAAVRRVGRVFFDVDEWFDFVRGQHLVIGTRLHGAVAALLQGVPAIVLHHDSRTREVCEFMGLPHLSVTEARGLSLEAIYHRVEFDGLARRHAELLPRYVDFLEANGVQHRFAPSPDR